MIQRWHLCLICFAERSSLIPDGERTIRLGIWWMLSSFWRTTCLVWCAAYNFINSSKNNHEKTLLTLPINELSLVLVQVWTRILAAHTNQKLCICCCYFSWFYLFVTLWLFSHMSLPYISADGLIFLYFLFVGA